MSATKIINVLKDDSFDEILDLFRNAQAEEVIFVLPKRSKLFSKEDHFLAFASEARSNNKTVSLMSSNPATNQAGAKYGFQILTQPVKVKAKKPVAIATAAVPPQDDEIIDDSTDAYDESVVVPSDERIPKVHDEDLEHETMHIEDEDAEDQEDGVGKKKRPAEEEIVDEDAEEPSEKDLKDIEEPEEEPMAPADDVATMSGPQFEVVTAAKIDGIVGHSRGKAVRPAIKAQTRTVPIQRDTNLENLESVWGKEIAGESLWAGITKKGSSPQPVARSASRSSRSSAGKYLLMIFGGGIMLFGAAYFAIPGNAKITVTPIQKNLDLHLKVQAVDGATDTDVVSKKVPGQTISIQRTVSDSFPASGQKEVAQKARGQITIYNNFSSTAQTLIATTRFASTDGLIFRTLATVNVPGTSVQNGKIVPGTVNVEVIADKPGQAYNVAAGKFMMPAFKERGDLDRYEKMYGQSTTGMSGGIVGMAKVVTADDVAKAKTATVEKLKTAIVTAFDDQAKGLKVLDNSSIQIKTASPSVGIDQAADTFTMSVTGIRQTVGFKETDLDALIDKTVTQSDGLTVLPAKLSLTYGTPTVDAGKGIITFDLGVKGPGFAKIDTSNVRKSLAGLSESAMTEYLKNITGVGSARVLLSPFWVSKVPNNIDRISVDVAYPQ